MESGRARKNKVLKKHNLTSQVECTLDLPQTKRPYLLYLCPVFTDISVNQFGHRDKETLVDAAKARKITHELRMKQGHFTAFEDKGLCFGDKPNQQKKKILKSCLGFQVDLKLQESI